MRPTRPLMLLALLLPLCVSGCNIVGPIAYFAYGPPKVDALHKLQKSRPTVIFVDDRANRIPRRSLRVSVAESAQRYLMQTGTLNDVIDTNAAFRVASQEKYGEPMNIVEIGEAVGAEVVIYVNIAAFTLSTDGQSFSPKAECMVKVIDVEADARIWPDAVEFPAGYPRATVQENEARYLPTSAAERIQAEETLADELGRAIADMFYQTDVMTSSQGRG